MGETQHDRLGEGGLPAGSCWSLRLRASREIYLTVNGDDFSAGGRKPDLDWYETRMQEAFELRLGHAKEDHHELCILNRVVRTCPRGVEYEADPQHVEELIRCMELEGCNSVSTPGTKETVDSVANDGPLVKEAETSFRARRSAD